LRASEGRFTPLEVHQKSFYHIDIKAKPPLRLQLYLLKVNCQTSNGVYFLPRFGILNNIMPNASS